MIRSFFLKLYHNLASLNASVCKIFLYLSALGLIAMTMIIGWQVFCRYVLNDSPAWSESLALLMFLYFAIFAAAVGVRERFHLGIVFIVDKLPSDAANIVRILGSFLVGLFGFFMMSSGIALGDYTFNHVIPTLGVSRAMAYVPFIVSGTLIVFFSLEQVLAGLLEPRGE